MRTVSMLILDVALVFIAFTAWAIWDAGFSGMIAAATTNAMSVQMIIDLVLTFAAAAALIFVDSRQSGINPKPYIAATVLLGSPGPLLYLARRLRPA